MKCNMINQKMEWRIHNSFNNILNNNMNNKVTVQVRKMIKIN